MAAIIIHLLLSLSLLLVARARAFGDGRLRDAAVALGAVVVGAYGFLMSDPQVWFGDFYKAYLPAGEALVNRDRQAFMTLLLRRDFVNIPVVAGLFAPFALMGTAAAGYAFLILGILGSAAAWLWLSIYYQLSRRDAVTLLVLFAANGPLLYSLKHGNTTHFALLVLIAALVLLAMKRDFAAGLLLGAVALVKLPLLLMGVYLLLRGRWRGVAGGATALGSLAGLSVFVFGWDMHVLWFQNCIAPFLREPIIAYNSQSIAAFIARSTIDSVDLVEWNPVRFSGTPRLASTVLVASAFGGVLWVLSRARSRAVIETTGSEPSTLDLELMTVLALAVVTSTLAWSHYYLWLLLPLPILLRRLDSASAGTTAWMWAALILMMPLVIVVDAGDGPAKWFYERIAVSHLLAGGLAMLALLLAEAGRPQRQAPPDSDSMNRSSPFHTFLVGQP